MATILAANESTVLLDGKPVEGIRSIEYRQQQERENVYGIGSAERIGMTTGAQIVEGIGPQELGEVEPQELIGS